MPEQETIRRALEEVGKGYAQYQYFFDNLNSPAWLEPLSGHGFFQQPPQPKQEGDYVRLAIWPESRYLVRMSGVLQAQPKVLEIALRIPDSENSRVHDDIADIALTLPPALSAKLVPQVSRYTQSSAIKLLLAEKVANLIVHLANGGQSEAALQLTSAALALGPDPRPVKDEGVFSRIAEPQPRFRDWYYSRIIQKVLPALVKTIGLRAVDLFCDKLDDAARLSFREEPSEDEDYFYIRQQAIEQGTGRDDIPSVLLCATRDAAVEVISNDATAFDPVMAMLQKHKWASFRRLELHISRVFLKQGIATAERFFKDPIALTRPSLRHEAVLLLRESFARLRAETQKGILTWMDVGPSDEEESIRRMLEFVGESVTDEKVTQVKSVHRRDRFAILGGQLPVDHQRIYDELTATLGPATPPDQPPMRTFSQVGAQSPKTAAELATMTVEDVLGFLDAWKPGTDIFAPTAEGLGGALASTVSQRPGEFVAAIGRFKTLDPTYVRAFFNGLVSALKNGVKLDWVPVLELAAWVGTQHVVIEGRKGGLMVADPDWGWSRNSVIDLLKAGFEGGEKRLAYEHRVLVWRSMIPLTDDPFPSPDDERGESFDPSFLSINCTRGRALFAVMEYAQWVRDCLNARKSEEDPPVTLYALPEVREVLERHLDTDREPTLTIRSVYGQTLSFLAGLDWEGFRANVERIIPFGQNDSQYFNAAWESFMVFNQANDTLLHELIPAYKKAVTDINVARTMRSPGSPKESLVEHLMAFYWRDNLKFDGEDRLLQDFYALASDALRGHAMWFIGRSASSWDKNVPPEVLERLRNLIERRLTAAEQSTGTTAFTKELAGFGWWFTSDKFGEAWSIQILQRVLRLTKKIDDEMDVAKLLAELSPQYPLECVACLALMVEGDRDRWILVGVEMEAQRTIKAALDCGQPQAVIAARRLVEFLIAIGHYRFRSLLA